MKRIKFRPALFWNTDPKRIDPKKHAQQSLLQKSSWYLAGGTALALCTGNRRSLDLDFFEREINRIMGRIVN